MPKYKYPKTFAAIKSEERAGWEIGDALLAEAGPPKVRQGRKMRDIVAAQDTLEECKAELAARGVSYSLTTLRAARDTAFKFGPKDRKTSIWVAHQAGSPKVLNEIVRIARGEGHKLTKQFVNHHTPTVRDALGMRQVSSKRAVTRTVAARGIGDWVSTARSSGRCAAKINTAELTELERVDLARRVQEMLNEWQDVLVALQPAKRARRKAA